MTDYAIYRDIAERTQGDIYIGVPVIIGLHLKSHRISGFEDLVLFFYARIQGK
jgi:hypothetical protein